MLAGSANGDPLDLLDAGASRQAQRVAAAKPRQSADDYARGSDGKMIIRDEDAPPGQHFPSHSYTVGRRGNTPQTSHQTYLEL